MTNERLRPQDYTTEQVQRAILETLTEAIGDVNRTSPEGSSHWFRDHDGWVDTNKLTYAVAEKLGYTGNGWPGDAIKAKIDRVGKTMPEVMRIGQKPITKRYQSRTITVPLSSGGIYHPTYNTPQWILRSQYEKVMAAHEQAIEEARHRAQARDERSTKLTSWLFEHGIEHEVTVNADNDVKVPADVLEQLLMLIEPNRIIV